MKPDQRDVLIVGSGAGGGTLALTLSQAGLDVLVLEKGREIPREDYPADEIDNHWRGLFFPPLGEEPHMLLRAGANEPQPTLMGWIACCLGGGTVHMGAYMSRFHPDDFRMRSRFGEVLGLADWPYSYQDLEPYLSRAEWEIGVAGQAGANTFEGPRSKPYPMPPLKASPLARTLEEACDRLGLNPFPTPHGINSRPYQGRPVCEYCERCASFGCRVGARGSAQEALIPRARATGRCEVRTQTMVREVTVGSDGRATGAVYFDGNGHEHRVQARIVCVCCSSVESARLLLMSKSKLFPDGLANGSGQVGKHLQFHGTSIGQALFPPERTEDLPFDHPNPFLLRSLADYYFLPDGVSDLPKGGLIIFQKPHFEPVFFAKAVSQRGEPHLWGLALKQRLRQALSQRDEGYRSLFFEVQHDYLPNDGTYVDLDPEVEDKWGLPVARIHLDPSEHQTKAGNFLVERGLAVFKEMGAEAVMPVMVGETSQYLVHGTCRAGHDPGSSVLDEWCQTHEVPNLFVVDGSFMPTSGGAPPTLTILANSFRSADHILERARQGDFG